MVLGSPTLKPLPRGPEDVEKTLTQLRVSEPQILISPLSRCLVPRHSPNSGVVSVSPKGWPGYHHTDLEGEELGCP